MFLKKFIFSNTYHGNILGNKMGFLYDMYSVLRQISDYSSDPYFHFYQGYKRVSRSCCHCLVDML